MTLVSFSVIGAQKCGTSALRHYLKSFPELDLSVHPEPHFFDNPKIKFAARPVERNALYHSHFRQGEDKIRGDVTPIYLFWRPCLRRMAAYNPEMKLIVSLRNPVDRAYSQWQMETQRLAWHFYRSI